MLIFMKSRRQFLQTTAAASAALTSPTALRGGKSSVPPSETLVKSLYDTLTPAQRAELVFPFDHPLRTEVDNNWHITKPRIGSFLDRDQQEIVKEAFLHLHSEEYRGDVLRQVSQDSGRRGFGSSSIGIFGEPGTGQCEFVLTGRHCTRRADGDSVAGKAFGGPIFYGHAADGFHEGPNHEGNVYWYQAKRANEVFEMLDGKQRETALRPRIRRERGPETVKLKGAVDDLDGLAVGDMTEDQKNGVRAVLRDLLLPFRTEDVDESMALIEKGGFDNLHLAFYRAGDIGDDGVWDNWQLEGPHMVWVFRGSPHVHTWVHIADPDEEVG